LTWSSIFADSLQVAYMTYSLQTLVSRNTNLYHFALVSRQHQTLQVIQPDGSHNLRTHLISLVQISKIAYSFLQIQNLSIRIWQFEVDFELPFLI